jgi:hypothetical protein
MGISRRGSNLIVKLLAIFLYSGFNAKPGGATETEKNILKTVPLGINEVLSKFNLDGRTVTYACCPQCLQTYKPEFKKGSSTPIYPTKCDNRPHPDSPICGEALLETRADGTGTKPIKPFVYHSFHDYLGMLLSRKDIEEKMDGACTKLLEQLHNPGAKISDVFEAKFMRTFEGPESNTLFVDGKGEGRYAFGLNVDFFNINANRARGSSTSCGIIALACLNLPLDIRYKPENMYLAGIIPGPKEPDIIQLN